MKKSTTFSPQRYMQRLYVLDCLRGLASLAVIFWHWQHFRVGNHVSGPMPANLAPLHTILAVFYNYGYLAVPLFFILSGFVFHQLYAIRIANGSVSFYRFIGLRISRLYPLHIGSLLLVIVLQAVFIRMYDHHFVYTTDTSIQFLTNFFLVHGLGTSPAASYSFNIVTWSISVEMGLYVIFYAVFRMVPSGWRPVAGMLLVGTLISWQFPQLGQGIQCFFSGIAISLVTGSHRFVGAVKRWTLYFAIVLLIGVSLTVWATLTWHLKSFLIFDLRPLFGHVFYANHIPDRQIVERSFAWIIAPTLVLIGVLAEPRLHRSAGRFATLGDISFAMYLLHFPLQIAAVIVFGEGSHQFASPAFLLGFICVLIMMSYLSYIYLEMPTQQWLRERFLSRRHPT